LEPELLTIVGFTIDPTGIATALTNSCVRPTGQRTLTRI
jgi:hypothetical protein